MTDERFVCLDGTPAGMTPQVATDDAVTDTDIERIKGALLTAIGVSHPRSRSHGELKALLERLRGYRQPATAKGRACE